MAAAMEHNHDSRPSGPAGILDCRPKIHTHHNVHMRRAVGPQG
jgi:hypothetical protein